MSLGIRGIVKRILPPSTSMVDARLLEVAEKHKSSTDILLSEVLSCRQELSALYSDLFSEQLEADASWLRAYSREYESPLVVSIASYGPRAPMIAPMLRSLKGQTKRPDLICLWLPKRDFPLGLSSLPVEVLHEAYSLKAKICWVDNDLGSHNKYFHIMQAMPNADVITLDDDCEYQPELVDELIKTAKAFPGCVVASRTNLIAFDETGGIAPYRDWEFEQRRHVGEPRTDLLPTGLGGVLYPAGVLPPETFDCDAILGCCPHADDLWLKAMEAIAGVKTVATEFEFVPCYIGGSQEAGLFVKNIDGGENDQQLSALLFHLKFTCPECDIVSWMKPL